MLGAAQGASSRRAGLVRTGRTKPYTGGNRGVRGLATFHEYRCRVCKHVGTMSWFTYGTPEKRTWRKGVALRVRNLPESVMREVRPLMEPNEHIEMVHVIELRPKNNVLIEARVRRRDWPINRHAVITVLVPENPEWICEGDLGRGFVDGKRNR